MFKSSASELFRYFELLAAQDKFEQEKSLATLSSSSPILAKELRELLATHESVDDLVYESLIDEDAEPCNFDQISLFQDFRELINVCSVNRHSTHLRLHRFQLLRCLSIGPTGATYYAIDDEMDREVSLFLMYPRLSDDPDSRILFLKSAQLTSRVFHSNVAATLGVVDDPQTIGVVRQWIHGKNLAECLKSRERISLRFVSQIGKDLALGLQSLHNIGLVHRDIKPANVIIEQMTGRAVIIDLGLVEDAKSFEARLQASGTFGYIAPEVLQGNPSSKRSDLFSLGVLLYWMCTGQHPAGEDDALVFEQTFTGKTSERSADIQTLFTLINELLDPRPERRPYSALEVANRLENLINPRIFNQSVGKSAKVVLHRVSSRRQSMIRMAGLVSTGAASLLLGHTFAKYNFSIGAPDDPMFIPGRIPDTSCEIGFTQENQRDIFSMREMQISSSPHQLENSMAWLLSPTVHRRWTEVIFEPIVLTKKEYTSNLVVLYALFNGSPNAGVVELLFSRNPVTGPWQILSRTTSQFQGLHLHAIQKQLSNNDIMNAESISFKARLFLRRSYDEMAPFQAVNIASMINASRSVALEFGMWKESHY